MAVITMREALNQALREEMLRDENVFLMGEEVAEYQGAYKVTKGLLQELGPKRVIDTPITELGFAGLGVASDEHGKRDVELAPDVVVLERDPVVAAAGGVCGAAAD